MSRRVQVLFLAALLGVLVCVGLGVLAVAGAVPAVAYAVVAVRDGAARVIVRRETEDDLLRLDAL